MTEWRWIDDNWLNENGHEKTFIGGMKWNEWNGVEWNEVGCNEVGWNEVECHKIVKWEKDFFIFLFWKI